MIEAVYEAIREGQDVRANLSLFRQCLKEEKAPENTKTEVFTGLLAAEDPKVRKNAALILGDLKRQEAFEPLRRAYEKEEKNFVKSAYLAAIGNLDCSGCLGELKRLHGELCSLTPAEEDKKHVNAQIKELEKILTEYEGIRRHTFTGYDRKNSLILTTAADFCDVTAKQIRHGSTKRHPLGVFTVTDDLRQILSIRTYRELLFCLDCSPKLAADPKAAGKAVADSNLLTLLTECHGGGAPFYFRLEIRSDMSLGEKASFAKKAAAAIEERTGRQLVNSTTDYEVEIRLLQSRDGFFFPCVKLYTVPMERFAYRKNSIAASIHPAQAALIMRLAQPYLKENAQILDPFCGVGTMLIERNVLIPAREMYGIDIYGEAVGMARENTEAAGVTVHYINRDFFDFTHAYLFDEIITDMPARGKKTKQEQDAFYGRFFAKAAEHLSGDAVVILYCNEIGFVKKQLRLDRRYRLLQEICMRKKDGYYVFIIGFKGDAG